MSFFFASDLSFPAFPHAAVIFFSLTFDGLTPHACTFGHIHRPFFYADYDELFSYKQIGAKLVLET